MEKSLSDIISLLLIVEKVYSLMDGAIFFSLCFLPIEKAQLGGCSPSILPSLSASDGLLIPSPRCRHRLNSFNYFLACCKIIREKWEVFASKLYHSSIL